MEASFAGQNIAITGGAAGIGLATAKALAALNADVYIADLANEPPADLKENARIHFTGGVDIAARQTCQDFMNSIPGRLDGLVNCAGIALAEGKIGSDEDYRKTMAVNVDGTWNMGTEALKRMSQQDEKYSTGLFTGVRKSIGQGAIVNVSSGVGVRAAPTQAAYSASKHAVIGLTRTWAADFPFIRINAVLPGGTNTALLKGVSADVREPLRLKQPRSRFGEAEDVADVIIFLLSEASHWVQGQLLAANGGSH